MPPLEHLNQKGAVLQMWILDRWCHSQLWCSSPALTLLKQAAPLQYPCPMQQHQCHQGCVVGRVIVAAKATAHIKGPVIWVRNLQHAMMMLVHSPSHHLPQTIAMKAQEEEEPLHHCSNCILNTQMGSECSSSLRYLVSHKAP
jgi:hypothetical protein